MEADPSKLKSRVYNVTGMSFTPAQIAEEIGKLRPGFKVEYAPDFRQDIAKSWPESLDDSEARNDWGWQPTYDLESMTLEILETIQRRLAPA